MSGVLIAGELLGSTASLTSVVPAAQIRAWKLPQGSPLPSILVTRVSRVKQQFLAAQRVWLVTERVQVTVRASNGVQREEIIRLVERACADRTGPIAGFAAVAVLLAGAGPVFQDDAAEIFMGSTDLRVSFNEPP